MTTPCTRVVSRNGLPVRIIRGCLVEELAGPGAGNVHRVDRPTLRIGSHATNDIVLPDQTVSRHHLELTVTPDGYQVTDRGSSNGTFLDGGGRLGQVTFVDPVTVRLGATVLRLTPLEDEIEVPTSSRTRFGTLVGRSPVMRELFCQLEAVAGSDCSVLIEGETGVGKEQVAESLHRESPRAAGPFVVVDCGALVGDLMEAELFGHARGAFTGATHERMGLLESANGGTLLLDEVGELPLPLQAKLLGALERRKFSPVGSSTPVPIDVRVIAATNRDLVVEVEQGRFRADLYYRLAVVRLRVPPLAERQEDVPMLVGELLAGLRARHGEVVPHELSAVVLARLQERSWPGNVRELRNVVERAALQSLQLDELVGDEASSYRDARVRFVEQFERGYLMSALQATAFNVRRAAESAQVEERYFRRLLKRHRISVRDLKTR
jgi:DNA-binding NtrC family response regulator